MLAVYAAVKFIAYGVWCYFGLAIVRARGGAAAALRLGGLRWVLGLVFGLGVFVGAGSIDAEQAARTYFVVYSPLRAIEWAIMAVVIAWRDRSESSPGATLRLVFWCAGGILVSFLTDLASPDGVQGRFCVGRCLC